MTLLIFDKPVGEIVAESPARSRVFERYRIDYCCGGKKTLRQACFTKAIPLDDIVSELHECDRTHRGDDVDLQNLTLTELCDHIETKYHGDLKESLPRLSQLTAKVAAAHGETDSSLKELAAVFAEFRREMELHTAKEERVLFPMCRAFESGDAAVHAHCGAISNPISVMMAEHEDAGAALGKMRTLTHDFVPPSHACNTYRAMLEALERLESETHRHVHTENEVLFPRAIEAYRAE